jgi:lysyl-tRNA synthetase class I
MLDYDSDYALDVYLEYSNYKKKYDSDTLTKFIKDTYTLYDIILIAHWSYCMEPNVPFRIYLQNILKMYGSSFNKIDKIIKCAKIIDHDNFKEEVNILLRL